MIGELAALCAAASWAFSSVLYRKALCVVTPFQANLIRFTSVSLVLVAWLAAFGKIWALAHLSSSISFLACLSGILSMVIGDTLYMYALKSMGVARAVPISFIYPLFTLVTSVLVKGERVTWFVVGGAISIVAGISLISNERKSNQRGSDQVVSSRALASALCAAATWSVSMTLMNTAVTSEAVGLDGLLALNTLRVLAAWIVLFAVSPIFDRKLVFLRIPWKIWLALASGGLIAFGFGGFLLSISFLYTQEARAVPISSTTPLFSAAAGIAFLHESVTLKIILGCITITLGILLLFI